MPQLLAFYAETALPLGFLGNELDLRIALETVFLCFQVRSLDPIRFPETPVGMLSLSKMREVEASVRYVLGL